MTSLFSVGPPGRLTFTLLALTALAVPGLPAPAAAQSYLERTPHLDGGWVGLPGVLYMDDWALFRTTSLEGVGLLATPVYRALFPLPRGFLIGGTLAANARSDGRDVWELFARVGRPHALAEDQWGYGLTAGYSRPAGSLDGELAFWKVLGPLRALGAVRGYSELDSRGGRVAVLGGAVFPPAPASLPLALAADLGYVLGDAGDSGLLWSAGFHHGIASTPFTVAFQISNARDPGFQGAVVESRHVHFGVAVMSPIPIGRFLGWWASGERQAAAEPSDFTAASRVVRASISNHAYWPLRMEVAAGTVVEWINADRARHTVTAAHGAFASGDLRQGDTWRTRFNQPGTYFYHCALHPFMQGIVSVR